MQAGKMRHRITIQQATTAADTYGQPIETWSTYAERWASIEPIRGREYWDAHQVNAEVTTRIRIRSLSGVTPKMRVSWNSQIFDIVSVIHVEQRNRETQLMCTERVGD